MGKTPARITADNVKSVADSADVLTSMKDDAQNPYVCDICNKKVSTRQALASHMKVHKVETVETVIDNDHDGNPEDPQEWVTRYARKGPIVAQDIIDKLCKDERVTFLIPEDPLNDTLTTYSVGFNGQKFDYPRGQYIELPRDIVTFIQSQYKESELAKKRNLIDRNEQVHSALTR